MIKAFKEWWNWRDKSIEVAEAIIALLPDEGWERMNFPEDGPYHIDIREWIMKIAEKSRCSQTMEDAVVLTEAVLIDLQHVNPEKARYQVMRIIDDWVFK